MDDVLVVTQTRASLAELDDENEAIMGQLAAAGLRARLVAWHDPDVDWDSGRMLLVRTTWDYPTYAAEFLAWLGGLEAAGRWVENPVPLLRWNYDKRYLVELQSVGVPVVAVRAVAPGETVRAGPGRLVIKPAVGAGSVGARILEPGGADTVAVASVVNPYMPEIARGELSVFLVDGRTVLGIRKTPGPGDWRVQAQWGGRSRVEEVPGPAEALSRTAVAAATRLCGVAGPLCYVRVDLVEGEGGWLVLEVEAIEPSLYSATSPLVVNALARAVARRLAG